LNDLIIILLITIFLQVIKNDIAQYCGYYCCYQAFYSKLWIFGRAISMALFNFVGNFLAKWQHQKKNQPPYNRQNKEIFNKHA